MNKITLKHPKLDLKIVMDSDEYFPDDPGNGTPVIVRYRKGTATYNCALGEGEVEDFNGNMIPLPDEAIDWLLDQDEVIEEFFSKLEDK